MGVPGTPRAVRPGGGGRPPTLQERSSFSAVRERWPENRCPRTNEGMLGGGGGGRGLPPPPPTMGFPGFQFIPGFNCFLRLPPATCACFGFPYQKIPAKIGEGGGDCVHSGTQSGSNTQADSTWVPRDAVRWEHMAGTPEMVLTDKKNPKTT